MYKLLLFTFLIFGFGQLNSQTIEIGQDAEQIKRLIEWNTKEHNKSDSYGNYSSARASWDVSYNNGQIVDVIQCYENQYYLNLRMSVNYCKHYIMENGKLAYTLIQYENVSKEKLVEVYDKLYEDRKISNLYFDPDYMHYSTIYLAKNGHACIEYRKTDLDKNSPKLRNVIEYKINKYKEEQNTQKLVEIEKDKRLELITSKVYDLKTYNINVYDSFRNVIKSKLCSIFISTYPKERFGPDFKVPSFENLISNNQMEYSFKNSYDVYYKLNGQYYHDLLHNISMSSSITLNYGDDKEYKLINALGIMLPTITVEGYKVLTEATYKSISVDYYKGITNIKVKNGTVTFSKYMPSAEIVDDLNKEFKSNPNGRYTVKYEISIILGEKKISLDIQ